MFNLFLLLIFAFNSQAFLSQVMEVKDRASSYAIQLQEIQSAIKEGGETLGLEENLNIFEKELKVFQKYLEDLERAGVMVEDLKDFSSFEQSFLKDKIRFLNNYTKKVSSLGNLALKLTSPEMITASESIETNRALREIMRDLQKKDLKDFERRLNEKKKIAEFRKKKQKFIKQQYKYMNRHQGESKFSTFYPFKEKKEKKEIKRKRNKILGVF